MITNRKGYYGRSYYIERSVRSTIKSRRMGEKGTGKDFERERRETVDRTYRRNEAFYFKSEEEIGVNIN